MPTRARVCAWIAGCGLAVPTLAMAQDRTEQDVVDAIVREGPQAMAIRSETEVTRREQLARLTYPNPGVAYTREGAGFTEFLQIEQPLPLFGVRGALSRAGVAATGAAQASRDGRLWMLRAEAATVVARLLAQADRLEVARSHARDIERLIDVLRTREREGEGSRFDRLRAEQELRDARHSIADAGVAAAEARAAVSAMLPRGMPLGAVARAPSSPQIPLELDTLIARAAAGRAELRALELAGDRADREGDAARRARLPSPTVFGGWKRAGDPSGRERGGVFGLSVSLPVFDAGDREAARWTAERARVAAELGAIEGRIRAEVAQASEALALRQQALADDDASAAEELMGIAEVAYREGEVGILELLDAVRTGSRARIRSLEIRLSARLAQIALERAVGEILWP